MKKIFALSLVLVSTLAMANSVIVRYPTVQIQGVFVSYDKLCVAGDMLVADSNYKPCVQWSNPVGEADAVCLRYDDAAVMQTSINYTEQVCTQWIERNDNVFCGNYEAVAASYPLTVKADYFMIKDAGENNEVFMYSKDFTVPACK